HLPVCPVPGMPIVPTMAAMSVVLRVGVVTDVGEVLAVPGVRIMLVGWRALDLGAVIVSGGRRVRVGVSVLRVRHRKPPGMANGPRGTGRRPVTGWSAAAA